MKNQEVELSTEIYDALMAPYWFDITSGIIELAIVLVVVVIAHYLAKRKLVGGLSMLICVYISIIAAFVPFALPVDSENTAINSLNIIFVSQIVSSVFALIASIHCLRFVLASAANKSSKRDAENGAAS